MLRTRSAACSMGGQVGRPTGASAVASRTASSAGISARSAAASRWRPPVSANAAAAAISPGSAAGIDAASDMAWQATSVARKITMASETNSRWSSSA